MDSEESEALTGGERCEIGEMGAVCVCDRLIVAREMVGAGEGGKGAKPWQNALQADSSPWPLTCRGFGKWSTTRQRSLADATVLRGYRLKRFRSKPVRWKAEFVYSRAL
eukprot:6191709-Pleurochrysis_carterae.AAC.3